MAKIATAGLRQLPSVDEVLRTGAATAAIERFGRSAVVSAVRHVITQSRAGGPEYVAGTSYFLPTTSGQPLVWSQGLITYYTDQGDLSPILPSASADALVADAWSQWTVVSTAAIAATSGGHLAEGRA